MDDLANHPMMAAPTLGAGEAEIRAWLKANRKTLTDRTPDEVVHMAVLCGFDVDEACRAISNDKNGAHLEPRAAFQVWRFEMAIEDLQRMKAVKELDLMPLWKDVHEYQTGEAA